MIVFWSGHTGMNGGSVGQTVVKIALAKQALPWHEALLRGVLCNVLVCAAVWMAMAGRSVVDKAVAIVFPISAFVAAGFEHSIANMYFFPVALVHGTPEGSPATWSSFLVDNLVPVTLGNIGGGAVLVGLVYWFVYLRRPGSQSVHTR